MGGGSRCGRFGSGWRGKDATHLKNEGCPDNIVHPECHGGRKVLIISKGVASYHSNMFWVEGVGWSPLVADQRLGGGEFGDDVGDYVMRQRPLCRACCTPC